MNYTLSFNDLGKLNGWQDVKYEICGLNICESQKFCDGVFQNWSGFSMVYDENLCRSYYFEVEAWGTMELVRDAAEGFASGAVSNFFYVPFGATSWKLVPMNEEAFVNG